MKKDIDRISKWLRESLKKSNSKGFVIGLSGGVDSTAVCGLAVSAVGKENVLGVLLPSVAGYRDDVIDGIRVADHFGVRYITHSIVNPVKEVLKEHTKNSTRHPNDLTIGNVQARIRMTILRMYAEINGYLVLGTTNLSEDVLGYFTKGGDGGSGVDLEPIQDYYKSEIIEFVRYFGLPSDLVNRKPSAGLWEGQTDEDELGFTYDDFEKYWKWRSNGHYGDLPVNDIVAEKIEKRYMVSEHKRHLAPKFDR